MIRAAVVGASGYVGGELLRILLGHPNVSVEAATSAQHVGRRVDILHPNLRGITGLAFSSVDQLEDYDVLFNAMPHRATMGVLPDLIPRAKVVIDLSADFRVKDMAAYERYYGPHTAPELVKDFVTGCPEIQRSELHDADLISVPGCMATAAILALYPAAVRGLIAPSAEVDARTGSSGSGASAGTANLHSERAGAMRVFAPFGHRHEAEIAQATGLSVRMTATGVEAVRGVQVLCRSTIGANLTSKDLWRVYREQYRNEPFIRLIRPRQGFYRYPEPKILIGSNFCDIGLEVDDVSRRVLVVAAIDNLVKGAAGNAVQCLNVRMDWPERLGLEFPGLHPA